MGLWSKGIHRTSNNPRREDDPTPFLHQICECITDCCGKPCSFTQSPYSYIIRFNDCVISIPSYNDRKYILEHVKKGLNELRFTYIENLNFIFNKLNTLTNGN